MLEKKMDAQFCCVYLTVLVYVKHEYMIEHLNSLFAQFYPNSKVTYACMHGYLVCYNDVKRGKSISYAMFHRINFSDDSQCKSLTSQNIS